VTFAFRHLHLFGGEAVHGLLVGELRLLMAAFRDPQRVGSLIQSLLRPELGAARLARAVIGVLRQREVGGGKIDLGLTGGDAFGTGSGMDSRQLGLGELLTGLRFVELARSSGLSMSSSFCPAATLSPRFTSSAASRPSTRAAMSIRVLSASPWIISGAGLVKYHMDNATIAATIRVRMTADATPARCGLVDC